ncbi:MAG: mechanosensitive ion channel family protein [Verrucomicrobia bacterium]|nr:mechanosensitive ion channel family protein [Verrucomicrobiota bacterium]
MLLWAGGALAQSVPTNAAERLLTNASPASSAFERSFGLDHLPWLTPRVLDVPLWQYLAMLVYILLAFLFSKLIDYVIGIRLKKWAAKTETQWDDILIKLLHGPIKVVAFVILLHIGFNVFPWPLWLAGYLSKGLLIIVACSLTYVALKLLDASLDFWRQRSMARGADKLLDAQLLPVIRISLRVFVVIIAILLTSHNLGLNVTSLIASLSIGGLALGLAAQDTLANLFGAVSVFADRPFNVGDRIRLESVDGTVESIGIRSTRVRNGDGFLVTIPNKTMGNATITNVSRRPTIKTEMNFGLPYETSMEKLRRALTIMDEICRSHPRTADLLISFNKFTDSALNILVVHHWNGAGEKDYLADLQKLNLAIKERFDQEGIEFAFPSQTHYVKQLP